MATVRGLLMPDAAVPCSDLILASLLRSSVDVWEGGEASVPLPELTEVPEDDMLAPMLQSIVGQ